MTALAAAKRELAKEIRKKVEKAIDLKMRSQKSKLTNISSRCWRRKKMSSRFNQSRISLT